MPAPTMFSLHFSDRPAIFSLTAAHGDDYKRFISDHRRDLAGALLTGTDLQGIDLAGADLSGTDLHSADLRGAVLDGATLDHTKFSGATLYDASLRGAHGMRPQFDGALMFGADGAGAKLVAPCFDRAVFEPAKGDPVRAIHRDGRADRWDEAQVIGGSYRKTEGNELPAVLAHDRRRTSFVTNAMFVGVTAASAFALPAFVEPGALVEALHHNMMLVGTVGVAALVAKTKAEDWVKDNVIEHGGDLINSLRAHCSAALGERWMRSPALKGLVAVVESTHNLEPLRRAVATFERSAAESGDRARLIASLRADRGRLFVCDSHHLDAAIAEVAAREHGHGDGVATVVRVDLLGESTPDVPACVRFDRGGATAVWFNNGQPTHAAYWGDDGRLTNVWDFQANEFVGRDNPLFTSTPALAETLEAFRRRLENIRPRALETQIQARERMGMPFRSPTHAILIDEKNKVYVCRQRLSEGVYGLVENPDPTKPAIIAFDGREFFYKDGKQVRSPGTIPTLQGLETPAVSGMSAR